MGAGPSTSSARPSTSAAAGPSVSSSGRPRPSGSATALLLERVLKQTAVLKSKGGSVKVRAGEGSGRTFVPGWKKGAGLTGMRRHSPCAFLNLSFPFHRTIGRVSRRRHCWRPCCIQVNTAPPLTLYFSLSAPGPLQDDWTSEQVQALQAAYFHVQPTHPSFWQEVAKRVPGRTAGACAVSYRSPGAVLFMTQGTMWAPG